MSESLRLTPARLEVLQAADEGRLVSYTNAITGKHEVVMRDGNGGDRRVTGSVEAHDWLTFGNPSGPVVVSARRPVLLTDTGRNMLTHESE